MCPKHRLGSHDCAMQYILRSYYYCRRVVCVRMQVTSRVSWVSIHVFHAMRVVEIARLLPMAATSSLCQLHWTLWAPNC